MKLRNSMTKITDSNITFLFKGSSSGSSEEFHTLNDHFGTILEASFRRPCLEVADVLKG
jgi:hypothetical protein